MISHEIPTYRATAALLDAHATLRAGLGGQVLQLARLDIFRPPRLYVPSLLFPFAHLDDWENMYCLKNCSGKILAKRNVKKNTNTNISNCDVIHLIAAPFRRWQAHVAACRMRRRRLWSRASTRLRCSLRRLPSARCPHSREDSCSTSPAPVCPADPPQTTYTEHMTKKHIIL